MSGKILVTGGAGFIGSNFIRYILENTSYSVVNADSLTYAGNLENLEGTIDGERHVFIKADITDAAAMKEIFEKHRFSGVINFAAESHVDRSILNPGIFIETNVKGTLTLLQNSLHTNVKRYLQISTDEVYGELGESEPSFTEDSPLKPNSPYAASKASADMLVSAFCRTYGLDAVITRCSNNYGRYQFPEKLIPLAINKASMNEKVPVYGDGLNVRDWIHVDDHSMGILLAFEKGRKGNTYNLGSRNERKNIDLVREILAITGRNENLIEFVKDRPGHDRRYAVNPEKAEAELGFAPNRDFRNSLKETVDWYLKNKEWVDRCISGEYREYYEKNYGPKRGNK